MKYQGFLLIIYNLVLYLNLGSVNMLRWGMCFFQSWLGVFGWDMEKQVWCKVLFLVMKVFDYIGVVLFSLVICCLFFFVIIVVLNNQDVFFFLDSEKGVQINLFK